MAAPRILAIPAVRRKFALDAVLLGGHVLGLVLVVWLSSFLHPAGPIAVLLCGVASLVAMCNRAAAIGMSIEVRDSVPVRSREDHPRLWDAVTACAAAAGIRAPRIRVLERRASSLAASWGLGRAHRLGVQRDFADRLPHELLIAIVAHEVAHLRTRDLEIHAAYAMLSHWLRLVTGGLALACAGAMLAFDQSMHALVAHGLLGLLAGALYLATIASTVVFLPHVLHAHEYAADALGVAIGGDPKAAAALMLFIAVSFGDNSLDARPTVGRTHPPPIVRATRILADAGLDGRRP